MQIQRSNFCPLIKEDCKGLGCSWFTQMRGINPQTGQDVDEWGCAIAWLPMLLVENAQMQRQTGAAVESFRNEMVKSNDLNRDVLFTAIAAPPNMTMIKDS